MKEVEYIPQSCRKADSIIEGSVKLRIPTTIERYEYMAEVGFVVNEKGEVDNSVSASNLRSIGKMITLSKPHYIAVNMKYRDGSAEFKSFDDLSTDANCDDILIEIAGLLMNGFRPTKN